MADGPMHCVCVTTKASEPLLLETNHKIFRQMGKKKNYRVNATLIMHYRLVQFVSFFFQMFTSISLFRLKFLIQVIK